MSLPLPLSFLIPSRRAALVGLTCAVVCVRSADNQWAGKHSGEAAIDYLEFVQRLLPPDFPKRDQMFVDDIASMAHEDTKKSAIKSEISSVHEFVQTFQDKVTTLPTCVCFLPDCLAPSASPH